MKQSDARTSADEPAPRRPAAREQRAPAYRACVRSPTDRRKSGAIQHDSEEVLRALANSIAQLAWVAEADGAVSWYNQRWYDYTGMTPERAAGWGWQAALDPAVLPQVVQRWRDCLSTGAPFEMEFPIRGADGQYRWFLTRANPVRDSTGAVLRWFGTNTDVDQVKRVEQALREESKVLELLNTTGVALAAQRELRAVLQTVTDAATGVLGARFGAFHYRGGDGARFTVHTQSGAAAEHVAAFRNACPALLDALDCSAGVLRVDDLGADPRCAALAPPVRSFLAMPVVAQSGEVLGSMLFGHPQAQAFTARSERIVGGIASQAAVAIDNTRLYEAARAAADERKALLERERAARAEAERSSRMKDEFLATLSHELRTPLSAILGWAQVLQRGSRDTADLQRALQTIERNARVQAQLIEDLLDMSRITSGKVLLDMQLLAPAAFIDAAVETVRPAADAKNIRIERHYDAAPCLVGGDPARLQQVIWNLLSNAIKFTPRGGLVRVLVRPDGHHVDITVEDNGAGIAPEFMAHVFERFRQADASTTRQHGGLGLGLAIVKHLIEQHGGTVRAFSEGVGRGASFTLSLPTAAAQSEAARARLAPYRPPPLAGADADVCELQGVKVLVVDDESDARALIKRILSDCHATVVTAADAGAALSLFQADPPDVLVCDLGMPGTDGFELLQQLRALGTEAGRSVPAVALTAFARAEDRVHALEAGFCAHLSKPAEPAELVSTVARITTR